jgi:hypothetical protein
MAHQPGSYNHFLTFQGIVVSPIREDIFLDILVEGGFHFVVVSLRVSLLNSLAHYFSLISGTV